MMPSNVQSTKTNETTLRELMLLASSAEI